jgi:hypothetical protein
MSRAHPDKNPSRTPNQAPDMPDIREMSFSTEGEPQLAVDGFQQILEMLRVADPAFRESLLRRLATRDHQLVADLRQNLGR